jgi:hypothetical protein
VYEVTDKKPIGVATYPLTLTNVPDGIDTHVEAKLPTGTAIIKQKWRVADGKLTEEVEIDGNIISRNIIKKNVEKTHPEHQKVLIDGSKAWLTSVWKFFFFLFSWAIIYPVGWWYDFDDMEDNFKYGTG